MMVTTVNKIMVLIEMFFSFIAACRMSGTFGERPKRHFEHKKRIWYKS